MSDVVNILMVGVGGQGVVLASDILAQAAVVAGYDVKKSEIHGMSQRGGPVFSHVRFGARVYSPVIHKGEADVLWSLEKMEILRWAPWARLNAAACYIEHELPPVGVKTYPANLDEEIARVFGGVVRFEDRALRARLSAKLKNTFLIGALSTLIELPVDSFVPAISALVPRGTVEANVTAFELGRELATHQLGESVRTEEATDVG